MVEQPAKIPRGMVQQPEGRELIMEADGESRLMKYYFNLCLSYRLFCN